MSNLSHIGSVGFTTKYITTGNIKGIQANPVVQYLLNSTFGRDKAHIGFLGAQTEVGLYINERTDNIVRVKTIRKGMIRYPYVSGQAFRY